jgi:D-beta-D-heptose 7-phosphate kinase/D-beta-D-heptose 1-phosphate adenosyltransferase
MGMVVNSREELAAQLEAHRQVGARIVSTNGVFDVLHVGHVRYLQAARALGDLLVVGINSDASVRRLKGPLRPIVPQEERAELIAALSCVDFVSFFDETTPVQWLAWVRPALHTKGGDYDVERMPETSVVRRYGGDVRALLFVAGHSTTDIIARIRSLPGEPEL